MALRIIGAVAALVSAAVHLWLWFEGVRDQGIVGDGFLVNAVGGAVIAILLVTWRHWIPLFLLAGFGATTLGAFIVSTTVGLFGIHASWDGWDEWVGAISEIVAIGVGVWSFRAEGWLHTIRERSAQKAHH